MGYGQVVSEHTCIAETLLLTGYTIGFGPIDTNHLTMYTLTVQNCATNTISIIPLHGTNKTLPAYSLSSVLQWSVFPREGGFQKMAILPHTARSFGPNSLITDPYLLIIIYSSACATLGKDIKLILTGAKKAPGQRFQSYRVPSLIDYISPGNKLMWGPISVENQEFFTFHMENRGPTDFKLRPVTAPYKNSFIDLSVYTTGDVKGWTGWMDGWNVPANEMWAAGNVGVWENRFFSMYISATADVDASNIICTMTTYSAGRKEM